MAVERFKIRCYRCNQLLAVAPNKAGTVVACPKCKADLLIPLPESQTAGAGAGAGDSAVTANRSLSPAASASASGAASSSSSSSSSSLSLSSTSGEPSAFSTDLAGMIPPELAALRPEDLRVEAEFFGSLTHEPPAPPRDDPFQFPSSFSAEALLPPPETSPVFAPADGYSSAPESIAAPSGLVPAPPPLPTPEAVVVPPIQFETPSILPPSAEPRRIHEVTLPASVVLAWSLFVLASVAMSFIAGLLVGHFLWSHAP